MKKFILIAFLLIFSLGAFSIAPDLKSEKPVVPAKRENKMSDEEINGLPGRFKEIHNRDRSKQTVIVQESGPRRGHRGMNREDRSGGAYLFVGGGAVVLLIILLIILL